MRESTRELAKIIADCFDVLEPIYEFGSLQVLGRPDFENLRPIFAGKEYVGCDMREGPGVDKVLDLHWIDQPDECAGTVLAFDTLEHVEYPHRAMEEVHRIMRPGGIVAIMSVMNFPIHDYPYDYWRFTPEAFRSLLKPFTSSYVEFAGEETFPHTVVGLGFKDREGPSDEFLSRMGDWKSRWFLLNGPVSPWRHLRRQLTPPIVRELSGKLGGLFR